MRKAAQAVLDFTELAAYSAIVFFCTTAALAFTILLWNRRGRFRGSMIHAPIVADLVLVGGGHAHIHVIKMLGMPEHRQWAIENGIRITLIAKDVHTPYSGMLPGFVAGHYSWDEIHIDLARLCRVSGVRLIHGAASKITANASSGTNNSGGFVFCQDGRPPLRYDCLSINIGSVPSQGDQIAHMHGVVPVKPIASFSRYYEQLLSRQQYLSQDTSTGYRIGVVGGTGAIELALSIQFKLSQSTESTNVQVILVTKERTILANHNRRVQSIFERILKERNVQVYYEAAVSGIEYVTSDPSATYSAPRTSSPNGKLRQQPRKRLVMSPASAKIHPDPLELDDCIWCVTAGVSSWLSEQTPFATTQDGFIRVHDTYEAIRHPGVFAVGDCCHVDEHPRPKGMQYKLKLGYIFLFAHALTPFLMCNRYSWCICGSGRSVSGSKPGQLLVRQAIGLARPAERIFGSHFDRGQVCCCFQGRLVMYGRKVGVVVEGLD
jgi:selenide, water dikinase